jgi:hypothetical protein
MRAVSEDKDTAALMGIDVNRIIVSTFAIGAAMAGAAGVLYALIFRQVGFFMGFTPGIKAFTSAVLGGIGNIPGAMLGGLVTIAVGTGMRPQEWSRVRWEHVDLAGRAIVLPASIAKNGVARRIPLRQRVLDRLASMDHRQGLVLGVEDLRSWRRYTWKPALEACELEYRRPYEMRHTYATWALRAGVSTFLVARRMGTSVAMIDKTYGQFAIDTEDHELRLLDAFDGWAGFGHVEPSDTSTEHAPVCSSEPV